MEAVVVDMEDNRVARLGWAVLLRRSWEVVDSNSISSRDSMAVAVDNRALRLGWVASRRRCWEVGRMVDSNSNISSNSSSKDSIVAAVVDWGNWVRWRVASWEGTASRRLGTMHTGTRVTGRAEARTRVQRRRHLTHRQAETVRPVEATGSRVAGMASSKGTDKRSICNSRNRVAMASNHTPSTAHPAADTAHRNHSSSRDMGPRRALTAAVGKPGMRRRVARTRLRGTSNNNRKGTHSSNIRRATINTPARHQCRSISRRRMEDNNKGAGTGSSRWEGTMDSNSSSTRLMLADSSSRVGMGSKGATEAAVGTAEEGTSPSGDDAVS